MKFNTFGELLSFANKREDEIVNSDEVLFTATINNIIMSFIYLDDTAIVANNNVSEVFGYEMSDTDIMVRIVEFEDEDDEDDEGTEIFFDKVPLANIDFVIK